MEVADRFHEHGEVVWARDSLDALKESIERDAPEEHADLRADFFRDLDKRASLRQRYFVYLTLAERLIHRGKSTKRRRAGRPRKGTGPPPPTETFEVRWPRRRAGSPPPAASEGRIVLKRARHGDVWEARLFSDLHAFLQPIYGAEKSYAKVRDAFHAVFGVVIEVDSVKREILKSRVRP
jgi:hypothetical protein